LVLVLVVVGIGLDCELADGRRVLDGRIIERLCDPGDRSA
jgi:hypothetical protein